MKGKRSAWAIAGLVVALVSCQVGGGDLGDLEAFRWLRAVFTEADENQGLLAASGTIQADKIRIASPLGGQIASIKVSKGQEIQAGDVLVVLDSTQILDRLTEARSAVAAAEAALALAQAGPRTEEIAGARAALSLARAGQEGAQSAWENAQDVLEDPQELNAQIVESQAQVKLAEQAVFLAEAELDRERLLARQVKEGTKAREAADWRVRSFEEALAAAQADLVTAQTVLDWLWQLRKQPLGLAAQANAAEGQVRIAEAGVAVSQALLDDLVAGPTGEEVALAEAGVRLAEAQAQVLQVHLDRCTLTSPVDGVVLDQALRVGELAAPAATILSVADLSSLILTVYVPVNRMGEVQLGQEVQVTVDSFPGTQFRGQVTQISDHPEFTPRNVATKEERLNTVYAVEIVLDNLGGRLKPGMPADALFLSTSGEPG